MKKLLLAAILAFCFSGSIYAQEVNLSNQEIYLDGKKVDVEGYNIDGSNYFKLRDVATILKDSSIGFDVNYNEDAQRIIINRFSKYTPLSTDLVKSNSTEIEIQESFQQVRVDSDKVKFSGYLINGNNYFKLRDLGKNLGFPVDYNESERKILITSEKLEPKDLISREEVKLSTLAVAIKNNTKDYTFTNDGLNIYDFIKDITVIGSTSDGKQHALDIEYLEGDNILLLTPIQLKYKGSMKITPVIKVEQGDTSEIFVLNSKIIRLDEITKGIDKNTDFALTLGYYEGEKTFKGLSVLNIKGGLK